MVALRESELLDEIRRQAAAYAPEAKPYEPSGEVIRLSNAISRALEHPDKPDAIIAAILQCASARYDCCADAPKEIDPRRAEEAVAYVAVSQDGRITAYFRDDR